MKSALPLLRSLRTQQDRIRRLAAEGGWILAGQIATVAGALVLVRVLTEYLTPAQYGELSLGLTLAALINQVVTGGLTNGVARFFAPALEAADLRRYLRSAARLALVASLVILIFAIVFLFALAVTGQVNWLGLAASALALSVLSGFNSILSGIQNAARQRATVALHAGLEAWLKIALAVSVVLWIGASSPAVVIGFVLSSLMVTASQLWFLRALLRRHVQQSAEVAAKSELDWMREIWKFSWPFSTWGVFTWLQQVSDRWALSLFATTTEVGAYAVVFQLGYTPIGLLSGLMMTLIGPILYNRAGDATDGQRLHRVNSMIFQFVGISIALTAVAFAASFFLHETIFYLLTSEEFRRGSYLLPWVVLAGGLFAAAQLLLIKLGVELRSKDQIALKIGTALIGIAANVIGASLYGIAGIVGALVVFSTIFFTWAALLVSGRPSFPSLPLKLDQNKLRQDKDA